MINGVHLLLYSRDPEADRAFFRDVLHFQSVDAGEGWLIFALPPAEMGIHPGDGKFVERHVDHELSGSVVYLMCDDLRATMDSLNSKGAGTTEIAFQRGAEKPITFKVVVRGTAAESGHSSSKKQ